MTNGATAAWKLSRITTILIIVWGLGLTLVPAQNDARDKEAKAIENLLIAPCCWRQPVAVHLSQESLQIRQEIRKMLDQGMSRQQILDAYVSQYGPRILSSPPARGFNALSYVIPAVGLLLGGFVVWAFFRRHKTTTAEKLPPRPSTVPGKYADLINEEVRR